MAMSDDGSPRTALKTLAQKLRHSLLDIRERALAALAFKLDNGLLRPSDVGSHLPILRALLEWFNFEETGSKEAEVLAMLRRIANEDPTSVRRLMDLGADRFLRDLGDNGCARHHHPAPLDPSVSPTPFQNPARPMRAVSPPLPRASDPTSSPPHRRSGAHLAPSINSLIAFWENQGARADSGSAPDPEPSTPAPVVAAPPSSYASAARRVAASAGRPTADDADDAPEETASPTSLAASAPARVRSPAADENPDEDRVDVGELDDAAKDVFLRNPRLAASYWRHRRRHDGMGPDATPEERAAAMRSILGRDVDPPWILGGDPTSATRGGALKLERVLLAPADEQRLFEIGVRLTYADEPALLLSALTELREGLLADLPAQALLQRPTALEATIALARAVNGPSATYARPGREPAGGVSPGAVRAAALETLRAVARAVKAALGHAADGARLVRPPPEGNDDWTPTEHVASRAATSYPPPPGGIAAWKHAPPPNAVPSDAEYAAGEALATLPVAHLVACSVIPSIAVPAAAGGALLVLEETMPLLELTPADDGSGGDAVADPDAVAARLGVYASAMENALAAAVAGVSPNGEDDVLPAGSAPRSSRRSPPRR